VEGGGEGRKGEEEIGNEEEWLGGGAGRDSTLFGNLRTNVYSFLRRLSTADEPLVVTLVLQYLIIRDNKKNPR
jgi:hypothetical protein